MAKQEKKMFTYRQRNGYDHTKTHVPFLGTTEEEYKVKITEPGQAITVRKLVERYEKGARAKRRTDGN